MHLVWYPISWKSLPRSHQTHQVKVPFFFSISQPAAAAKQPNQQKQQHLSLTPIIVLFVRFALLLWVAYAVQQYKYKMDGRTERGIHFVSSCCRSSYRDCLFMDTNNTHTLTHCLSHTHAFLFKYVYEKPKDALLGIIPYNIYTTHTHITKQPEPIPSVPPAQHRVCLSEISEYVVVCGNFCVWSRSSNIPKCSLSMCVWGVLAVGLCCFRLH